MPPDGELTPLTEPELAAFLRDLKRPDRPRLRFEGVAMPAMLRSGSQHDPVARVDFVDCDLTGWNIGPRRFQRLVLIDDCSFQRVTWETLIRRATIRASSFERVTLRRAVVESTLEDCNFDRCVLEHFQFSEIQLRRVAMRDVRITPRAHWTACRFEDVRISGRARTLVLTNATFDRVDFTGFELMDSDLGRFSALGWVRFPAAEACFVVPTSSLPEVDRNLADRLSPAALEAYRAMAKGFYGDYAVVDPTLFRVAPDLPGMNTTPAEVDAIMEALRRVRVAEIPGSSELGGTGPANASLR